MGSIAPRAPRHRLHLRLLLALALAGVTACDATPPQPTGSDAAPAPSSARPVKVVGDLALAACDPQGLLPCEHQAVVLLDQVAATGLALTYSTEWADGRTDRPAWNADALGLGGWSFDELQRYDAERGILLAGDGSWRFAAVADIGGGMRAVPSYDGFRYFVFDSAWRHVRTVDAVTGTPLLELTYDDAGRLTSINGQRSGSRVMLTVQRTADGSVAGLVGAGETRTSLVLDGAGRLAVVGRPDGTSLAVAYTEFGLIRDRLATGRGFSTYEWDPAGRLAAAIDGDGVRRELAFAAGDGAATVTTTNAAGAVATLRSERAGDVVRRTFTDLDGTVTVLELHADGSTRLVEADGTETTAGASAHPRWGLAAPIVTPIVETRPDGTAYRVERTTSMGTGSQEPAGGAWQSSETRNGERSIDAYDPATRTLIRTDPAGRRSVITYDEQARVVAQHIPGEAARTFSYDADGRLVSMTEGEGATAATTSYAYDTGLGEVTMFRPDGSVLKLRQDGYGRLRLATTADENVAVERDAAGALLQVRHGAHPATSIGYSEGGRATAFVPPAVGDDAWYELTTYTPAGDVATIGMPGQEVEISSDAAGRTTAWTFDRGTSGTTWDRTSGLLATTTAPDGVTTSFAYDGWVPAGLAWTGPVTGEVGRSVDGLLRTTQETVNGGDPLSFEYDAGGLATAIGDVAIERDPDSGLPLRTTLGRVVTTFTYDASARLASSLTTADGAPSIALRYVRDLLGRIISVERTDGSGDPVTTTYRYDGSGRLAGTASDGVDAAYDYDEAGNRIAVTRDGKVASRSTYDDRDRVLAAGDTTFRWSPDGTLLERRGEAGRTTFDLDDLGDLRVVGLPDGRRVEYVVDAAGRRIGRKVDGVLTDGYLYGVGDRIVAWTDGGARVRARFGYDESGRLVLVRRDGRDLLVVTDQVGSPVAMLDASTGDVVARATYDAWGNILGGSMAEILPIGFAGGLADPATGLVQFAARDYDPAAGRWIAPDPIRYDAGDPNLYRYASGDPVNNADPTGLATCLASACGGGSAEPVLGRPVPVGGRTGGSRSSGGSTGGYHKGGPSRGHGKPIGPGSDESFPVDDDGHQRNESTLPAEHPLPPGAFGPDDEGPDAVRNCFGPGCRYIPGTDSGYCWGDCAARGGKGSGREGFTWCTGFCVFGEPHLVTADGARLSFQAAGEFLIARSPDGAFELQGRFQPSPTVETVTRVTALAIRAGGDRVALYADPDRPLVVNGEPVVRAEYAATLSGGAVLERHGSDVLLTFPDGGSLGVHLYGTKFMDFSLVPAAAASRTLVGVLGGVDGDRANDLVTRDGTVVDPSGATFRDELYGVFAESWRITDAESLFDYLPGESTSTFQDRSVPREHVTLADLDAATRARADALCRAIGAIADPVLSECTFDVGMTGDPTYASSAAMVAAGLDRRAASTVEIGTMISRGQRVGGTLVAGAVDRYHFTAAVGDIVYLEADVACGANVDWRLVRPNGALATFADACTDIGRWVLPEAGEWRIEVDSDDGSAGPYAFRVLTVAAPQEKAIAPGGSASGTTTAPGEWHRYRLAANAGDVVYLDATGDCGSPMSWRLLRPDGSLTTFDKTCLDLGRRVLDIAGDWVIEVFADGTETGAYAFRVIGAPATREGDVTAGQTVTDATTRIGEWHRYSLTAKKGQVVYLDALGECHPGLNWQLLRPDGGLKTFAKTCDDLGRWVLDVAGDWSIEIYAPELATGAYSFKVIGAPAVKTAALRAGTKVSGTIGSVGEWHRYTLAAKAGQKIVIDAQGDCIDELWWRLLKPDGQLTTFAKSCTDSDVRTLDVAGDWVIEVYSDTMATGPYAFTVQPG